MVLSIMQQAGLPGFCRIRANRAIASIYSCGPTVVNSERAGGAERSLVNWARLYDRALHEGRLTNAVAPFKCRVVSPTPQTGDGA